LPFTLDDYPFAKPDGCSLFTWTEMAMRSIGPKLALALGLLALTACGESVGDRGLSGAGIGGAAGAVGGALVGAPLAGAAIGAGAGAAAGALTSPSSVDLGKPVWER